MKANKLHYLRYMDDFIILTKTHWQLRRAVKLLNQFFNAFGFMQHSDKTFIKRIAKGFDWMGAWITDYGTIRYQIDLSGQLQTHNYHQLDCP